MLVIQYMITLGYAKEYVVNKSDDMILGNLHTSGNFITSLQDSVSLQDAATKQYVDACSPDPNNFILKTGDTMLGKLAMGGNSAIDLANPIY